MVMTTETLDMAAELGDDPLERIRRDHRRLHAPANDEDDLGQEVDCGAFGWCRGLRDRAENLEIRFRDGLRRAFPYGSINDYGFDPSQGIALKVVQADGLVLWLAIAGVHLNGTHASGSVRLFEGLLRSRVPWVRECDEAEAEGEPQETLITQIRIDIDPSSTELPLVDAARYGTGAFSSNGSSPRFQRS